MIYIANDHAGFALKKSIVAFFDKNGIHVEDLGCFSKEAVSYPSIASIANAKMAESAENIGIYICGTGVGISIAANRARHIRAALCSSPKVASLARRHNDANVLVLAGRFTSKRKANKIVREFLISKFEGGRHIARVKELF